MKLGDYLRCVRLNTSVALREFYKGRQIAYQDCLAPRAHDSALFPLREPTADGEQGRAGQLRELLTRACNFDKPVYPAAHLVEQADKLAAQSGSNFLGGNLPEALFQLAQAIAENARGVAAQN